MELARHSRPAETWTQPVNPLDEYHAALIAQSTGLHHSMVDECRTFPAPAHRPHDKILVKPRSQFELIAELSHELTGIAHDVNLVTTEPSFLAQRLLRIVIKDAHVFTAIQGLMIVDSLTRRSPVSGQLLGSVDIPDTTRRPWWPGAAHR